MVPDLISALPVQLIRFPWIMKITSKKQIICSKCALKDASSLYSRQRKNLIAARGLSTECWPASENRVIKLTMTGVFVNFYTMREMKSLKS